jgi:hypothetical protein
LPPDVTSLEIRLLSSAYAYIYRLIPDSLDKFIIAFHYDLGNNVENTALAAGVSRKTVWERKRRIKKILQKIRENKYFFSY